MTTSPAALLDRPARAEARSDRPEGIPTPAAPGKRLGAGPALLLLDAGFAALAWPPALWLLGASGAATALLPPLLCGVFLYALGLYRRDVLCETRRSLARALVAVGLGSVAAATLLALAPSGWRGEADGVLPASLLCFASATTTARIALFVLRRRGAFRRRLLVVGAGRRAFDLLVLLRREGRTLHYDVVFVHDPAMGEVDPRLQEEHGRKILPAGRGFLALTRATQADEIVVAPDERRGLAMEGLLACRTAGYPVHEYLRFLEREIGRVDIKRIEIGWLLYADGFSFGLLDRVLKRALDVGVSLAVLALTAPFLLAAAIAVKLSDGGPVLYRQARVTRDGRVFEILKLRTMGVNAEARGAVWAAKGDPRVTRIGRFLRRTRLDELPQLYNILRGDMSFVGPRPERPEFTRELAAQLPLYNERLLVKAGLTGWAQVNYPYGASLDDARSKLSYDLYYVKNFGILFDALIILQTLRVVLWPGGGAR